MTGFYDALNALFDTINRALKLTFWTVWGRGHLFIIVDTVTLIFPSFRAPVFNNVTGEDL